MKSSPYTHKADGSPTPAGRNSLFISPTAKPDIMEKAIGRGFQRRSLQDSDLCSPPEERQREETDTNDD